MQVLSSLPEAVTSRSVAAHPQRKAQVAGALATDITVGHVLHLALAGGIGGPGGVGAGLGLGVAGAGCAAGGPAGAMLLGAPGGVGAGAGAGAAGGTAAVAALFRRSGLQLLQAWVELLGSPPKGLEHDEQVGWGRTWRARVMAVCGSSVCYGVQGCSMDTRWAGGVELHRHPVSGSISEATPLLLALGLRRGSSTFVTWPTGPVHVVWRVRQDGLPPYH